MRGRSFWAHVEHFYIVVSLILLSGGVYLAFFAGSVRAMDGSTDMVAQSIKFPAYCYGLFWLVLRLQRMLGALRAAGILGILTMTCVMSAAWSLDPALTLRRSLLLVGTTLFAFALYIRFDRVTLAKLLGTSFLAVAMLLILCAIFIPSIAVHQDHHYPAVRGLFPHKNVAGRTLLTGYVVGLLLISVGVRKLGFAVAGLCALAVASTLSVTANASLVAVSGIYYGVATVRRFGKVGVVLSVLAITFVSLIGYGFVSEIFVEAVVASGRDLTLTGRTTIWSVLADTLTRESPWFGFGYEAFWSSPRGAPLVPWGMGAFIPPHAHNGVMQVWAGVGLVGVVMMMFALILAVQRVLRMVYRSGSAFARAYFVLLLALIMTNVSEVSFIAYGKLMWVLFVYIYLEARALARESAGAAPGHSTSARTSEAV